jgi:hypothetical protein
MAVVGGAAVAVAPPPAAASPEVEKRCRSPRMYTSAIMTVLPPNMMFGFPSILALREILLPVSYVDGHC